MGLHCIGGQFRSFAEYAMGIQYFFVKTKARTNLSFASSACLNKALRYIFTNEWTLYNRVRKIEYRLSPVSVQ